MKDASSIGVMADKPHARPNPPRLTIQLTLPAAELLSKEVAIAIMAATCRRAYAEREGLMSIAEQLDTTIVRAARDTVNNTTTHADGQRSSGPTGALTQPAA